MSCRESSGSSPKPQPTDLAAWAWAHPREAADVLLNNADRLPEGRADEDEVRAYIDARIADGTPLRRVVSLAAVKTAESAGKLDEALEGFVCEWPHESSVGEPINAR